METTFGKVLQKIRRSKDMTQRDVAKEMEMDFSYFSRLENDRFDSKPTRDTVNKIADALKCTEDERAELLAAAGRITEEIESAARQAGENPVLGKLFRSAVHLSPERLNQLMEEIELELGISRPSEAEKGKDD